MSAYDSPHKIRILLADDHPIVVEGLRVLLSVHDDIAVVGEAHDGRDAVAAVGELRPDIVIMDVAMPNMNGIEATRLIRAQYPETRVLILTQHEERQYILPLLRAGASGIVLKRGMVSDLITALRVVAQGETSVCPAVATIILDKLNLQAESSSSSHKPLTARESEILKFIVMGKTNAWIAEALSVSIKTVQFHRANIMEKFGVHNAVDLVRETLQRGLIAENGTWFCG